MAIVIRDPVAEARARGISAIPLVNSAQASTLAQLQQGVRAAVAQVQTVKGLKVGLKFGSSGSV